MVMVNPRTIKPRIGHLEFPVTGLPAGTSFRPIQSQSFVSGVAQPGCNFSRLKRPFSRPKVTIEQLGNFFSRAWFPNLVQCSKDMVFEAMVRVSNLTHFRLSDLKMNLPKADHSVSAWSQATTADDDGQLDTSWRIILRIASGPC